LPPLFFELLLNPDGRRQITQILQGDVYDRATVPILGQMREAIQKVASDSSHPWHSQLSRDLLAAPR
jgi:hypothetical protein